MGNVQRPAPYTKDNDFRPVYRKHVCQRLCIKAYQIFKILIESKYYENKNNKLYYGKFIYEI